MGLQVQINKAYLPSGWSIKEQLADLGYSDSDLDLVLLSHLHSDHASGLPMVQNAKKFLVSEEELDAGKKDKLRYIPKMWKDVELTPFQFKDSNLGPFHRSFDLFGDKSVQMIWTPGHSEGLSSTLITGAGGKSILLASDVGYDQSSIEERKTQGISINRKWSYISSGWANQMSHSPNILRTIVNHDVNTHPEIITLS
ncbi:MBL fold metallo-hydrolase [Companilactobacillus metriopterae]|uniref:MBL fold metallo-hydrolase n=1 Tax=Companilactobacillus metriopterae TaxID=1909267 RepID=UPI0019D6E9B2|nr:MBL fold metallo-hydrolase [Companilactobacillus metriopterae]